MSTHENWRDAKKDVEQQLQEKLKRYVKLKEGLGPKLDKYDAASESKKDKWKTKIERIISSYENKIRNSNLPEGPASRLLKQLSYTADMIGSDIKIIWKK